MTLLLSSLTAACHFSLKPDTRNLHWLSLFVTRHLTLAPSVAVGTALVSGPPHGSVREGLPHTALTSGSCDGQPLVGIRMLSLLAACRTHHKPCDSHPRLCVRHECACGAFPLVGLLPSANSAANA